MAAPTHTPSSIGATAHWTAAVRALESARPDRLFDDPWAEALAGEVGLAWMAGRTLDSLIPITIRTRYFDDFMQRTIQETGLRQVVLPAAGLETRAYRLSWPEGMRWFELDQPEVLRYKENILSAAGAQPKCQRRAIAVDLTSSWGEKLVQASFDPAEPSLWLLEGFLFYLSNQELTNVLQAVTDLAAPQSWLGCDVINSCVLTSPYTIKWVEMQAALGAPWTGTLDAPVGTLAALGWQAGLSQPGEPAANYGRWKLPVLPTLMPGMPHSWYVTARKN